MRHPGTGEQVLPIGRSDVITALLAVKDFTESDFLLMLTADGMIKKTPLGRFEKMQASGLSAIKLKVRTQLWPMSWPSRCRGCHLATHDMKTRAWGHPAGWRHAAVGRHVHC